ncbi:uncharacterized protein JOD03_000087 [Chryseomicrobium aureum]|nr:uncharacterized protein [Chryseomicrobium aureum]
MQFQPVTSKERFREIDQLRGFSLLGILIVNMLFFHSPYIYFDPFNWYTVPQDKVMYQWIDIWVQGSFYPLFAMLFGFGLALQFERMQDKFVSFGLKRMGVLLLFGILHVLLLWAGDILITYAASGFVLLFMLRLSAKWLFGLALLFYMIPNIAITGLLFLVTRLDANALAMYNSVQGIEASILAYGSGNYAEAFSQRLADWMFMNQGGLFLLWMLFTILPLMMLGAAAAKGNLIGFIRVNPVRSILIGVSIATVGTVTKWVPYFTEGNILTAMIQDSFGGPIQAIGYAFLFLALAAKFTSFIAFRPFETAGRMSLSIYILMSILATTFFYSYGLGFYGQVDVVAGTWIALGIYALCVIFAELWLSRAKQGPLEKIWRTLTYPRNK